MKRPTFEEMEKLHSAGNSMGHYLVAVTEYMDWLEDQLADLEAHVGVPADCPECKVPSVAIHFFHWEQPAKWVIFCANRCCSYESDRYDSPREAWLGHYESHQKAKEGK